MSNQIFKIKRNDTLPALQLNIVSKGNLGQKIDYNLSGVSSISFSMADECNNLKVYQQSAQTICHSEGTIQYNWQDGDTDTSGTYRGEFELTYATGQRMSLPQMGSIKIEIFDDINSFD